MHKIVNSSPDQERYCSSRWDSERLYLDGDEYFSALEQAIDDAKLSVHFESYIFDLDPIGEKIVAALERCCQRGLRVMVHVDGVGALGWRSTYGERLLHAGAEIRVFNPLPWEANMPTRLRQFSRAESYWSGQLPRIWSSLRNVLLAFRRVNQRNHRKLIIIDESIAFLGSRNISVTHIGPKAWKDVSIRVRGESIRLLLLAFARAWDGRLARLRHPLSRRTVHQLRNESLLALNFFRRLRRRHQKLFESRIRSAQSRVWLVSPYFVPTPPILNALVKAARRGVDVRILLPADSDIFFIPWVVKAVSSGLLDEGVRIFEYQASILHEKLTIIDDWYLIGSSNLNHRSLIHDLEADVVVTHPENQKLLEGDFIESLGKSAELSRAENRASSWRRLLGRVLLLCRYFL